MTTPSYLLCLNFMEIGPRGSKWNDASFQWQKKVHRIPFIRCYVAPVWRMAPKLCMGAGHLRWRLRVKFRPDRLRGAGVIPESDFVCLQYMPKHTKMDPDNTVWKGYVSRVSSASIVTMVRVIVTRVRLRTSVVSCCRHRNTESVYLKKTTHGQRVTMVRLRQAAANEHVLDVTTEPYLCYNLCFVL